MLQVEEVDSQEVGLIVIYFSSMQVLLLGDLVEVAAELGFELGDLQLKW